MTPKQEAFCLAYIETGNASEAYRRAYNAENMKPETVNRKAKDLLDNGKIRARLAELREPILERHGDTVDSLLVELEAARARALAVDRPSAAVSATMGKARLLGLDRQQLDVTVDFKIGLADKLKAARERAGRV
ncbi:terminase small subunit [Stutzerimonas kunmingensis]|jgi:phage terminase small subunit|uniref:terminase small subunit n=1 Tax=Stutzerimonas kunmingensis TaxID=1211807 RepID=UPI0028A77155|nr:terminase small subunit [Stutzerimonas kunmingensis]